MLTIQKSVTENELIDGCLEGNSRQQRNLYEKYAPKMLGVCFRYIQSRDEAEHVMVGGFVKVFQNIKQFKREGSFEGWIRRIVVNECLMYIRKNRYMSLETEVEKADIDLDYEEIDAKMNAESLMILIQELPVGYRTVFNLYAIEGYNHYEIGEMLGISENTSKSQLSRARKILQSRVIELQNVDEKKEWSHGRK